MKLVIVEDQTMLRELLVMACIRAIPTADVSAAANATDGLALCRERQPAVVLLDVVLPDGDGLRLVPDVRAAVPHVRVITLSSHTDEYTLYRAQSAGVNGFVDKNGQTLDILQEAITAVMAGQTYACSVVKEVRARVRADPMAFSKVLSDREMELLGFFGRGWSNEEVAARAGLSPRTARNHRQNIMTKLGLGSTPQLIRYALEKGFTRVGE
ncbi:histidine kinase [Opitutaceae bacterium TAV5]|nr:histidine kinase [Opitutaceae bacterium TAV5]